MGNLIKVLVTGGAGFIGSHISDLLLRKGFEVTIIDNLSTGRIENIPKGVEFVCGDICDCELLLKLTKGRKFVFHLAAFVSVPESIDLPDKCININTIGTLNLIKACVKNGVGKIIFSSTSAVYGDDNKRPISEESDLCIKSPYAMTKIDGERLLNIYNELNGLNYLVLRYFNVFGPRQDPISPYAAVIPKFILRAVSGDKLTIHGDGTQTRDFVFVEDVAVANLLAAESDITKQVFNVGTGKSISINDLANMITQITGAKRDYEYHPRIPGDSVYSVSDNSKIQKYLKWNSKRSFIDDLHLTYRWYLNKRGRLKMVDRVGIKSVLVLGGAGYLGSWVCRNLLDSGFITTAYDSLRFTDVGIKDILGNSYFKLVEGDIRDISGVSESIKKHDAVILLASLVGEPACDKFPDETVEINWTASNAVVDICRYYKIKRFIFASTDSCYGIQQGYMNEDTPLKPISLYGKLKMAMEEEILAKAKMDKYFSPTILRMATIYGLSPRMRFDLVLNKLSMLAVIKKKIMVYGGEQWRPFVHVRDAAGAYISVLKAPPHLVRAEVFNVGSNEQNLQIKNVGKVVADALPGTSTEYVEQPPDLRDYHVNFNKVKLLGFQPRYNLRDGIVEIKEAIEQGLLSDPIQNKVYYNA